MLAEWIRAPGYLSCEQCIELKKSVNKIPDCATCLIPRPLPGNIQVLFIYHNYLSTITNGYGGLVLSEIVLACELENILPHRNLISKIIIFFEERNKKENNG